jgi:hypothetical protein
MRLSRTVGWCVVTVAVAGLGYGIWHRGSSEKPVAPEHSRRQRMTLCKLGDQAYSSGALVRSGTAYLTCLNGEWRQAPKSMTGEK